MWLPYFGFSVVKSKKININKYFAGGGKTLPYTLATGLHLLALACTCPHVTVLALQPGVHMSPGNFLPHPIWKASLLPGGALGGTWVADIVEDWGD